MAVFRSLLPALCLALLLCRAAPAADLGGYKDLQNDFMKVINVKEQVKEEERYLDTGGKVELKKVPRKDVVVTAELKSKPPSSMDNLIGDMGYEPYFRVCLTPYDAKDKPAEEICQSLRFKNLVRGDIGGATFRLPEDAARYALRVVQRQPSKEETLKFWYPTQ